MKMKKIFSARFTLISIAFLILPMFWLIAPTATVSAGSTALDPDAPIPELVWATGDPYPVVNGHVIYPAAPAYSTHWWIGAAYPSSLATQNARTAYMSIRVPFSVPKSDEFYYVLLSAWDSAGSYDQLGFSNTYGTWGLTYSWTTGPPSNLVYHYQSNAMALSLGVTYTFNITVDNGVTHFVAEQGSVQVWSLDASTGGNNLVLSRTYSGMMDYTVYEEVWKTSASGGSPDFDFDFFNNNWVSINGVTNAATWTDFTSADPPYSAPADVDVVISGDAVLVDNPKATILFQTDPSAGTITFGLGGVGPTYVNGQSANSFVDSDPLSSFQYVATANAPSGYVFDHWECSGSSGRGVYVPDMSINPTTVEVNGDGWLKAVFSNPPPIVEAGPDQTSNEGATVSFSGSFTDPGVGDTQTISWDFGDGHVISGTLTPTHVYGDNGAYTVKLTVIDSNGGIGTDTLVVTVNNVAPAITPFGPFTVNEGTQLILTATAADLGSDDLTFKWEFQLGPTVTHVYYNNGVSSDPYPSPGGTYPFSASDAAKHTYGDNYVYTVTLTVTDDDGASTTYTTTVTVNNVAPTISGSIVMTSPNPANPEFILPNVHKPLFTGSVADSGSDDLTFTWDWGDGSTTTVKIYYNNGVSSDPYPSPWGTYPFSATDQKGHIYSEPGTYTVTLTVEDDDGGVDTATYEIKILGAKEAKHIIDDLIQALPANAFKGQANQRKNAFHNMFTAIDYMLANKEYQGAIMDLKNNIRSKMDGSQGGNPNDDWIKDATAQARLCWKIDALIAYLKTLL